MRELALEIIRASIAKLATSDGPDALRPRLAGEIDMAFKLRLIDYTERDELMAMMLDACLARREQLHQARLAQQLRVTE